MSIKRYEGIIHYREYHDIESRTVVYARSQEDADAIARMKFFNERRDKPEILRIEINETPAQS